MFYQQVIVCVVLCLIGYSLCVINNRNRNSIPNRRLYFYNTNFIPHAAAALNMIIPQALYKPIQTVPIAPHPVQFTHYNEVDDEDEENSEEYENHKKRPNLQLFTFIKPKKTKKKMKQNKKGNKKIKQFFKKCLPFKLRIIKKSDVFKNDPIYVNNNYDNLHYTLRNQNPKEEDVALISFNTSGILENKPNFPQVLHFLYPRYNVQQPPTTKKLIRKIPQLPPKKPIFRRRRPWTRRNKWRLTRPGKPHQEYHLEEPIPGTTGGSPPPSPLYNIYKDNRIPLSENYHNQEAENNLIDKTKIIEVEKYSDPDYYRYGIYDQNQFNTPLEEYNKTAEADTNTKYYYHSTFSMSPEKVVTVTPTTSWVPIPQVPKMDKKVIEEDKLQNNSSKINFKSGGFKSLSFGNKIPKNCSTRFYNNRIETFNCLEKSKNNSSDAQFYTEDISVKPQKDIGNRKKGRSSDQEVNSSDDMVVTAKYPEDDFNHVYISTKHSSSVRAGRSEIGLSAVVSESLLVREN